MFAPADGSGHLGQLERTAAGAATGILKTLALHPLDTARVRISTDVTPPGMPRRYSGIVQCLAATYWAEGLRGWYKVRAVRSCASSAAAAAAFPFLARSLAPRLQRSARS